MSKDKKSVLFENSDTQQIFLLLSSVIENLANINHHLNQLVEISDRNERLLTGLLTSKIGKQKCREILEDSDFLKSSADKSV